MNNLEKIPSKIEDILEIEPMYKAPDDECHDHVKIKYKYADWRKLAVIVRINPYVVDIDDDRCLNFEKIVFEHSCSPYGLLFIGAINYCTGEWIAFPRLCEPIIGIKDRHVGNGLIENSLKTFVGEQFGFDDKEELYCERCL